MAKQFVLSTVSDTISGPWTVKEKIFTVGLKKCLHISVKLAGFFDFKKNIKPTFSTIILKLQLINDTEHNNLVA